MLLNHPLLFYIRTYPRPLILGVTFLLITNLLDAIWPLILKEGIDRITTHVSMGEMGRTALTFFLVMASLSITRYGWRMGFGRFHTLTAEHLRTTTFRHLVALSPGFFLRKPVGELMSLLTNDVQSFRNAVGSGLLVLADGFLILVIVIPIMISMNFVWTLYALAFLPLVPLLIWLVMKRIHDAAKAQQESFARVTAHSQESVAGIRIVKGFALENVRLEHFNKESKEYERTSNVTAKIDSLFHLVMEFGVTIGTIIFLFSAKDDMISGAASIGTFVAFHRYIMKIVWPMTALGLGISQVQKGFGAFSRIRELLNEKSEIEDRGQKALGDFESLEFHRVSFQYPGATTWALRDVSFRIKKGESLGIAGAVGAGKTTLLSLLTRQYAPSSGEILLNGSPLETYSLADLRQLLTLIPQDVFLFSETVTWNVGFGHSQDFSDQQAEAMAKQVELHDEVIRLPQSYQSLVGEKGVTLSGGQKQRLALARGLVMDSQALILDDVLSAIDTKTERRIDQMLFSRRQKGGTQILVAHRWSTLMRCSHLLVLTEGQVESFGARADVQAQSPFMQDLQKIQKEEMP